MPVTSLTLTSDDFEVSPAALANPADAVVSFLNRAISMLVPGATVAGPRQYTQDWTQRFDDGGQTEHREIRIGTGELCIVVRWTESHAEEMIGAVDHDEHWQGEATGLPPPLMLQVVVFRTTFGGSPSRARFRARVEMTAQESTFSGVLEAFHASFRANS